jgi:hypothetical protein
MQAPMTKSIIPKPNPWISVPIPILLVAILSIMEWEVQKYIQIQYGDQSSQDYF